MKKYVKLTPEVFAKIKELQSYGLGTSKTASIVNTSNTTAYRVFKAETWNDYKQYLADMHDKYNKTSNNNSSEQMSDAEQLTVNIEVLKDIRDSLSAIETTMNQTVTLLQGLSTAAEEKKTTVRRFF